jgi:transcriptional regulator with XRE-family HTH domain
VPETFGERLRALRTRRRLTPSALAHAVGVTEGAIRQMESGQTKTPSFMVALKLAHVLGVTPTFLGTGRDAPPETGSPLSDRSLVLAERLATQIGALDRRVKSLEAWRRAGTRRKAPE